MIPFATSGKVQITSWTGSPTSIKPYGAGGERKPLTHQEVFGSVPTHNVKRIWRSGQQRGHRVTCYHPARVGTGESGLVLSRVEPVAHVSRQLGRVKVARRPGECRVRRAQVAPKISIINLHIGSVVPPGFHMKLSAQLSRRILGASSAHRCVIKYVSKAQSSAHPNLDVI